VRRVLCDPVTVSACGGVVGGRVLVSSGVIEYQLSPALDLVPLHFTSETDLW
jgi:hypothetical protein